MRILQTDFSNFFWRTPSSSSDSASKKAGKIAGWWSSPKTKRSLLGKYRSALDDGYFENPSEFALRECLAYQDVAGGDVQYVSIGKVDPADDKHNHGDRVIADALANFGMEEMSGGRAAKGLRPGGPANTGTGIPAVGSFGWRREQWQEKERRTREW
jgi:hypothetical protein